MLSVRNECKIHHRRSFRRKVMARYIFLDDDVFFLNLLRVFFGDQAHQYLSEGHQLGDILRHHGPFDALISDYDMPQGNGLSWAQWAHKNYPSMGIIILSGHERPHALPPCIQDWILKPVAISALETRIQRMTGKAELEGK